jgi:hypothetical protein
VDNLIKGERGGCAQYESYKGNWGWYLERNKEVNREQEFRITKERVRGLGRVFKKRLNDCSIIVKINWRYNFCGFVQGQTKFLGKITRKSNGGLCILVNAKIMMKVV